MLSFQPLNAGEMIALKVALERNGADGTPVTMNARTTAGVVADVGRVMPPPSRWRKFRGWASRAFRIDLGLENNVVVPTGPITDAEVASCVSSIPCHY